MRQRSLAALCGLLLAVLLPLFYPALVLNHRLAPEAALQSVAPWRVWLGPYPQSSPLALEAACSLGPRLAAIARDPAGTALWNPWIGAGRGGWLASASEGGTPLVVLAAWLARPGWSWTALLALTVTSALVSTYWVVRLLGFPPAAAAVGAVTYALSGAASSTWLTTHGAALALGPLLLVPVFHPTWTPTLRTAAGAAALSLLFYCGPQGAQFVALAGVSLLTRVLPGARPGRGWALPLLALALAAAVAAPRLWLFAAAREPGAPMAEPAPTPAPGLRAVVVPFSLGDPDTAPLLPSSPDAPTLRAAHGAFLGAVVVLLAAFGVLRPFPLGGRGFWVAMTFFAGFLTHLPQNLVAALGIVHRPWGVTALGCAILAAAGAHLLTSQLPSPTARPWLAAGLVGVVLLRLLPVTAHTLPYAPPSAANLTNPVTSPDTHPGESRLVAFGATLPPDTSAIFGIHDVRGASLSGEPRFATQLRPREDGTIGFDRVLDPAMARLGARLLLEPVQLHVISAEVFSRTVVTSGRLVPRTDKVAAALAATAPGGAMRVALPATATPLERVELENDGVRIQLAPDPALAGESDAWRWFLLPLQLPAGEVTLLVYPATALPAKPTLLWDTSGLLLLGERAGARTWLANHARPFAFIAPAIAAEGDPAPTLITAVQLPRHRVVALAAAVGPGASQVQVTHSSPAEVKVQVHSNAPRLLVLMVKHRPALWRALIDGRPAPTDPVDGVWTGLVVPAGTHQVELRARLPWWVALVGGAGVLTMAVLVVLGCRGSGAGEGVAR